jgi:hypothetical protein
MSISIAGLTTSGIAFTRGLPRAALDPRRSAARKVLLLGAAQGLERRLESEGVKLARTASVLEAQRAMAAQTFDAVLVQPEVQGALELVKAMKLGAVATGLRSAADRHTSVPFFVVPFAGETEYAALVRSPAAAFLEDEQLLPLADAVLRLDVARLTGHSG